MAKTIKFNLILDNQPVAAIDSSLPNKDIVLSLINIFNISDADIADIEEVVSVIEYQEQITKLNKIYV